MRILASTSVPFRPTTVQMPNFALIETKRITVYGSDFLTIMYVRYQKKQADLSNLGVIKSKDDK